MSIKIVSAYDHAKEVGLLFTEYTKMLMAGDYTFQKYLGVQNYDEEITHLNMKYGIPYGRLYIVYYDNQLAGCIGLRKIDKRNCEMKRLVQDGLR